MYIHPLLDIYNSCFIITCFLKKLYHHLNLPTLLKKLYQKLEHDVTTLEFDHNQLREYFYPYVFSESLLIYRELQQRLQYKPDSNLNQSQILSLCSFLPIDG